MAPEDVSDAAGGHQVGCAGRSSSLRTARSSILRTHSRVTPRRRPISLRVIGGGRPGRSGGTTMPLASSSRARRRRTSRGPRPPRRPPRAPRPSAASSVRQPIRRRPRAALSRAAAWPEGAIDHRPSGPGEPQGSATCSGEASCPRSRRRPLSARRHFVSRPTMWAGRRIVAVVFSRAWRIACLIQ